MTNFGYHIGYEKYTVKLNKDFIGLPSIYKNKDTTLPDMTK